MFTNGQLIFGILFFIVFVIIVATQYKKDLKLHKKYYKGSLWVLLAFVGFIGVLAALKFFLM